jgi:tRNA (adenine22-N1)-methyltransferase
MIQMTKLSNRLFEIYSLIEDGSNVIDIGSDHALLPISLVETNKVNKVVASDVSKGPIKIAKEAIQDAQLEKIIEVRQGDGLEVINYADNFDTIVISGMGGELISNLIQNAPWFSLKENLTLILQANNEISSLRKTLALKKISIINEKIIFEKKHYYEIIKARLLPNFKKITEIENEFGPILLTEKNKVFLNKIKHEINVNNQIIDRISLSNENNLKKINKIRSRNNLLKAILEN